MTNPSEFQPNQVATLASPEAQNFASFVIAHSTTPSSEEHKKYTPVEADLMTGRYTLTNTNGEEPFLVEFQYHPGDKNNPDFPEPSYIMEIQGVLRDTDGNLVYGNPNQEYYTLEHGKNAGNENQGFSMAFSDGYDNPRPVTVEKRVPRILSALKAAEDEGRLVQGYDDSEEKQRIQELHDRMKAKHSWW